MNKQLEIWGRVFDLGVVFDVYEGEPISTKQNEALSEFVGKSQELLLDPSCLKEYLIETSNGKIPDPIDNIFKYVMPKALLVKRSSEKRIVALLCNYKFDPEHGIAVVFEDEVLAKVTSQASI